jgi:hypothetical protein
LTGLTALEAGEVFNNEQDQTVVWRSCAGVQDGHVFCWGTTGVSMDPSTLKPPTVVEGLDHVNSISLGTWNAFGVSVPRLCASFSDGTVGCEGDYVQRRFMKAPLSGVTSAASVPKGDYRPDSGVPYAACIMRFPKLDCWLFESHGGLSAPFNLPEADGTIRLTKGADHTCAILVQVQIKCWGDNSAGQLGQGSHSPNPPTYSLEALKVVGL